LVCAGLCTWTKEEDQTVIDMRQAGVTKWSQIAAKLPTRIGKQIRERWLNHLDPSLCKGSYKPEEDAALLAAVDQIGTQWVQVAKMLPGRPENSVKNRWHSINNKVNRWQSKVWDPTISALASVAGIIPAPAAGMAVEAGSPSTPTARTRIPIMGAGYGYEETGEDQGVARPGADL
jgi:hypothetical protein